MSRLLNERGRSTSKKRRADLVNLTVPFIGLLGERKRLVSCNDSTCGGRDGADEAGLELLTFFDFPKTTWKSIRTANTLKTLNREFRRRNQNNKRRSAPRTPH